MFRLKYKQIGNFKSSNLMKKLDCSKLFSTVTPATTGPGQVSTAPPKTKEQLKIEGLMMQWPEYLRNPRKENIDMILAKDLCQDMYKYHQGDKKYQSIYEVPVHYMKRIGIAYTGVNTTDAMASYLKEFEGFIPDAFIISKFENMAARCPEKTPEFFREILPQVKKIIINADRQAAPHLAKAVTVGVVLNLADNEYWDMLVYFF
jgi:hypothetical protein